MSVRRKASKNKTKQNEAEKKIYVSTLKNKIELIINVDEKNDMTKCQLI